jgi:hypothetical protein
MEFTIYIVSRQTLFFYALFAIESLSARVADVPCGVEIE